MKKIYFLLLIVLPFIVSAQDIKYDTIRVSPNDERNIHRTQSQQQTPKAERITRSNQPILLDRRAASDSFFDKRKLRYGANIGLSLSRYYSSFNFGPQVGYQLNNHLMLGAGVKYYYNKMRAYQYNQEYLYKNNLLGANLFGYVYPVQFLTIFAQPEINHLWSNYRNKVTGESTKSSGFVPSVVVGGGLRLGRSHVTINYDLVQHINSPHPRGWFLGVSAFF